MAAGDCVVVVEAAADELCRAGELFVGLVVVMDWLGIDAAVVVKGATDVVVLALVVVVVGVVVVVVC